MRRILFVLSLSLSLSVLWSGISFMVTFFFNNFLPFISLWSFSLGSFFFTGFSFVNRERKKFSVSNVEFSIPWSDIYRAPDNGVNRWMDGWFVGWLVLEDAFGWKMWKNKILFRFVWARKEFFIKKKRIPSTLSPLWLLFSSFNIILYGIPYKIWPKQKSINKFFFPPHFWFVYFTFIFSFLLLLLFHGHMNICYRRIPECECVCVCVPKNWRVKRQFAWKCYLTLGEPVST